MADLIDITGQRFGKLIAKRYMGKKVWLCICDCGNEKEAIGTNLRAELTKSCGCLPGGGGGFYDLIGQRFGAWIVLEYLGSSRWLCQCDCGTTRDVDSKKLRRNQSKSCGCSAATYGEARMIKVCDMWGIKKETEKMFNGCKNKTYLRFDLFVPHVGKNHNGFLFEYQGLQHYEPIDFSGRLLPKELQATFEELQYHDELKRSFATDYNFRLRAIHYSEYDGIEAIILETIGEVNIGLVSTMPKPSKLMGIEIVPLVGRQLDLFDNERFEFSKAGK